MGWPVRRGYSLVELLVAIAMVAVLFGLTLPAVQKVRESAARTVCSNNLKQLGLALHGFHDTHRALPAGTRPPTRGEPSAWMTWLTRLLPYVEQGPQWAQTVSAYQTEPDPFRGPSHVGLATPMKAFSCPSDGRALSPHDTHHGRRVALTNYLGVNGTDWFRRDGVLYPQSAVRFGDVSDGTANTLAAGERPPSPDFWFGWWYAGVGQRASGSPDFLLGVRERNVGGLYVWNCSREPAHFTPGRIDEQCDVFHYWSPHLGGAHFLFCDGACGSCGTTLTRSCRRWPRAPGGIPGDAGLTQGRPCTFSLPPPPPGRWPFPLPFALR